ncbi:unnamed protein product, partial [Discosporangium mesarthrocarpum]
KSLVAPHVESFNHFLDESLLTGVKDIPAQELQVGPDGPVLRLWFEGVAIGFPAKRNEDSGSSKLTPRECRERGMTYQSPIMANICFQA